MRGHSSRPESDAGIEEQPIKRRIWTSPKVIVSSVADSQFGGLDFTDHPTPAITELS